MNQMIKYALLLSAVMLVASPAAAERMAVADYFGFGWETGGFPPSEMDDELVFVCVADWVHPNVDIDLGIEEVTYYIHGLQSTGEFTDPNGNTMVAYSGGVLEMYADTAFNSDWGVFPPNATAPSTFFDGRLLFQGAFTSFAVALTSSGNGAFEGSLDGVDGELLGAFCTDCAYTWGGSFNAQSGAQIPDGYDLQIDGVFEVDAAVSNDQNGWGALKALYQD